MYGEPIGILLSKQVWKQIKNNKYLNKVNLYQYVKKGEELGIETAFFTINNVLDNNRTVEAYRIENESNLKEGTINIPSIIYNPTKLFRKKNIKRLRQLSQHPEIQVINEHHHINEQSLYELVKSKSELQAYLDNGMKKFVTPFTIHLLAQKNISHKWNIPAIYAKDLDGTLYTLDEMGLLSISRKMEKEQTIYQISKMILEAIHFYYPGIYEVGLQFSMNENGQIYFKSTCSVSRMLQDLNTWQPTLYKDILEWPIQLAYLMSLEKGNDNPLEKRDEIDSEDTEEVPHISISIVENEIKTNANHFNRTVWAKFKEFEDDDIKLQLPKGFFHTIEKSNITIQYGIKSTECQFIRNEETALLKDNSFYHPIEIFVSSSLVKELHITLDINYQVKITSEGFVIGPTIGLLLGEKNQMYNLQYMEKYNDRFEEYGRYGGLIIAFSSRSIDWDKRIAYGMIYNPTQKIWKYGSAPIPSTIYRRNFHQNENRINQLKELTNHQLFNSYHFKKSDLYLLQDEPVICKHLPKTHLLTDIEELITFLHEEMKIILKPAHLSRGRGIFILELNEKYAGYMLYDYRKKYRVQHLIQDKHALIEMLKSLNILDRNYIFQTYIPLLKVNERPFDIRVVMQKENVKEWKCSGIECRVAGENEDLTNIARGGSAMTLEEVVNQSGLSLSHSSVRENVLTLCHYFCKVMDKNREHFAEFGLDIALDENGYPWIIEANIFPSFKGFKKMDYDTYLKIRYQPIFYAVNLQGFNVTKEGILDEVYNQSKLYLE